MTDYKEFLVPVEIAKELKEIGFDEPCLFVLNPHNTLILSSEVHDKGIIDIRKIKPRSNGKLGEDFCSVPTYEQVFGWFRENGLYGNIETGSKYNSIYIFSDNDLDMGSNIYPTYEEAREELLKRLIKIYKENI